MHIGVLQSQTKLLRQFGIIENFEHFVRTIIPLPLINVALPSKMPDESSFKHHLQISGGGSISGTNIYQCFSVQGSQQYKLEQIAIVRCPKL